MSIEKVVTVLATLECASAGRASSLFVVVASVKCLLTLGANASNFWTERQTFWKRTWLMTSDTLTFDLMGAVYLNLGVGLTSAVVLGSGVAKGA